MLKKPIILLMVSAMLTTFHLTAQVNLDTSFGNNGVFSEQAISGGGAFIIEDFQELTSLEKILLWGTKNINNNTIPKTDIQVVRLNCVTVPWTLHLQRMAFSDWTMVILIVAMH